MPTKKTKGRPKAGTKAPSRPTHKPPPLVPPGPPVPWGVIMSDGRLGCVVPLVGKHGEGVAMEVEENDWNRVSIAYGHRWTIRPCDGGRYRYVMGTGKHSGLSLARLIVRAQPGQTVVFRDGDAANLARGNLELLETSEARARAFGRC